MDEFTSFFALGSLIFILTFLCIISKIKEIYYKGKERENTMENEVNGTKHPKLKFYLGYTLVFIAMCAAVFSVFLYNGKTFVWERDGMNQHYVALLYYAKYLRSIIKNILVNHSFSLPTYSLSIGYGSDIITTLSYYVLGDPIAFLSVLVPVKYMIYFYEGAIILRIYLSGISFSAYSFYRQKSENGIAGIRTSAIFAGTIAYVFCGYVFYGCIRHPYFATPMIYLPLVFLGVEKIIDGKKPYVFTLAVFLEAISNFYFFYMVVVLTVLYVAVRLITVYGIRGIKEIVGKILKIAIYAIIGTGMSCVVFIPTVTYFLQAARGDIEFEYNPIYLVSEYEKFFRDIVTVASGTTWRYMGYAALVLIAVFALFMERKKHRDLKFILIVLTIGMMIPVFNSFMNGMSYPASRWTWGYGFFLAFSIVVMWDKMLEFSKKKLFATGIFLVIYITACILWVDVWTRSMFFAMAMAFACLVVLQQAAFGGVQIKTAERCLIALICLNVFGLAFLEYSPYGANGSEEFLEYAEVNDIVYHDETKVLNKYTDKDTEDFSRYQGDVTKNGTLNNGYHNTQYFWSLADGNITKFQRMTNIVSTINHNYINLDNRTMLATLANARYLIRSSNLMYNYEKVGSAKNYKDEYDFAKKYLGITYEEESLSEADKKAISEYIRTYSLWKNVNFLPFGYTYEKRISEETLESLSPVQTQEAMMQAVATDDSDTTQESTDLTYTSTSPEYTMDLGSGVTYKDGNFTVENKNATVMLHFKGSSNAETYLRLTNIQYTSFLPTQEYTDVEWDLLSNTEKNKVKYNEKNFANPDVVPFTFVCYGKNSKSLERSLEFKTPYFSFYPAASDYMINFGYDENPITSIKITFPMTGTYHFDDVEVLCQPMDNYEGQVAALAEDTLQDVDMHDHTIFNATNTITGNITLDKQKYLMLTIPYSSGWKVYVDGERAQVYKANVMFMAVSLTEGSHDIVMKYETPNLKLGIIVSLACFVLLIASAIVGHRKTKRRETDE